MQIGMITNPWEDSFRFAAEQGLDFVEFCINKETQDVDLAALVPQLKKWMRDYGIAVGSIGRWKPGILLPDGTISPRELEAARRLTEICAELECPNYVCGCSYAEKVTRLQNYNAAVDFFGKVIDMAAPDTRVSVYNCKKGNFVYDSASWQIVLEALPKLGIKFDPANSIQYGYDYLQLLAEWADRVNHVHLKGTVLADGKLIDNPPAGMDSIDWKAVIAMLRSVGYDRGLSLEPHSNYWVGQRFAAGISYSVNYFDRLGVRSRFPD